MNIIDEIKQGFSKEKKGATPSPSTEIALARGSTSELASDALTLSKGKTQTLQFLRNTNMQEMPQNLIDLNAVENAESAEIIKLQANLKRESLKQIAKVGKAKLTAENAEEIEKASEVNRKRFVEGVKSACEIGKGTIKTVSKSAFYIFKTLIKAAGEVGSAALDGLSAVGEYSDKRAKSKLDKGLY